MSEVNKFKENSKKDSSQSDLGALENDSTNLNSLQQQELSAALNKRRNNTNVESKNAPKRRKNNATASATQNQTTIAVEEDDNEVILQVRAEDRDAELCSESEEEEGEVDFQPAVESTNNNATSASDKSGSALNQLMNF